MNAHDDFKTALVLVIMGPISKTHYKRREGTNDVGGLYETYVLTWFALKVALDEDIVEARIASNINGYGDFDDFVMRIKNKNGKDNLYAMQLKHKKKPNFLPSFFDGSKIFSLTKHQKSFKQIKDSFNSTLELTEDLKLEDMVVCFYSNVNNISTLEGNKIEIDDKKYALHFDTKRTHCDDLFRTDNKTDNAAYKFDLTSLNITENSNNQFKLNVEQESWKKQYEEFFSNLILHTGQKNVEDMRKLIDEIFTSFGKLDPEISEKFIRYIADFFSKEEDNCPFLTKIEIKLKLLELLVNPLMPEPGEIIEAEHINAWSSFFDGSSLFVIEDLSTTPVGILYSLLELKIRAEITCTALKPLNVNFAKWNNYYSDAEIAQIRNFKDGRQIIESLQKYETLTPKRLLIAMWRIANVPLILKVHDGETTTYLNKVLNSIYVPKNYVVICQDIRKLQVYNKFTLCKCLEDSSNQTDVLRTLTLSLQGRNKITLDYFIGKNTEILKKISLTMLLKFFQKDPVVIGVKLPVDPKRYMKRKFYKLMFDIDIIEFENMIFLMEGSLPRWIDKPTTIDTFVERHLKDSDYKVEKTIILTMNGRKIKDVNKYVKEIKQSTKVGGYGIHFLRKLERSHKVEWIGSWGPVKDFFYLAIDRYEDFADEDIIEEDNVPDHFGEVNLVNIVCADPGMGKSTILGRLTYRYDDRWIVRINLVEYYNAFKQDHLKSKMLSDPIAYFYKNQRFKSSDDFTDEMFDYYKSEEKLGIFVDGYDEVSIDYRPNVLKMLKEIMKTNNRIWIACRTMLKYEIQEGINIFAIDMKNFTNSEILSYFSDVKIVNSVTDITVDEIIKQIDMNFLRIPLHANIVATVLEDDESGKMRNFNQFEMPDWYEEFIQMKFRIYFREKEKIDTNQHSVEESAGKRLREIHEKMALILIYGTDHLLAIAVVTKFELEIISHEIESSKNGLGLITAINDFIPVFLHAMFADYLGAHWLAHNNDLKLKTTMHNRLMIPEWRPIRNWFNMVVAKSHPLHAAVLYDRMNKVLELCNDKTLEGQGCMYKDNFDRTALHMLFAKIGSKHIGFNMMQTLNTLICFLETSDKDVRFLVDWFGKDWLAYSRMRDPKELYYGAVRHGLVHLVKLYMGRTVSLA